KAELELQKAHDELKKSEEKRLLFLKSTPERMVNIDLKGKILYVNQASTRKIEDLIGTDSFQYVIPEERKRLKQIIKYVVQAGKKRKYKAHYISPDGEDLYFDCSAVPIKEEGKVIEILIIAADITERRKAEAALRESEEKFRTLAEKSPNMIFISKDRSIYYVNTRCEEVMGYTKKEFYDPGFEFINLIAPESMAQAQKNFEKHRRGKDVPPNDNTLVTKEGKRLDAIITTKLIQYAGETATLGVITDITERKKAEQNLKKAHDDLEHRIVERTAALTRTNVQMKQEIEERKRAEKTLLEREEMLRTILESSPDAISVTDVTAKLIECNQSNVDMLGYSSKSELIGTSAFNLIAKKDQERARINSEKTLKEGIIKNIDYTLLKKDGTEFPAEMSASVVQDASGKLAGFVAIIKDITERRKAEEALIISETELRKQKVALEEKNIALREIIAQIEIEKQKIEEDIDTNVELVLTPILDKLRLNDANHSYVNLLKHHLDGLTSSFGHKISDKDINLTPREIEICNMIKGGMHSKDISKMLNISNQTVERHRKNIRHKLGIANKRVNLTSHLRKM
ncbi:PAS domain S-box protein, partial [Acidobacteriota bacterium]